MSRHRLALVALAAPIVAGLAGLGVWQLQRLAWKEALIAQVDQRLSSAPVPAPGPATWARIGTGDVYTRLSATGRYTPGSDSLVQAVTDLGPGWWVMTPFVTDNGTTLLVNRGFVAQDMRAHVSAPPAGPVTVSGLLRLSEPGGGFLHSNDAAADRWYSRDVAAIAGKRGLHGVAPYFIDADARTSPGTPRGGLTVIRFANNHLQYALTWFAMAAGLAGAVGWMILRPHRD